MVSLRPTRKKPYLQSQSSCDALDVACTRRLAKFLGTIQAVVLRGVCVYGVTKPLFFDWRPNFADWRWSAQFAVVGFSTLFFIYIYIIMLSQNDRNSPTLNQLNVIELVKIVVFDFVSELHRWCSESDDHAHQSIYAKVGRSSSSNSHDLLDLGRGLYVDGY